MLISIFTPSHINTWLPDLYESLQEQTHQDRERVILLNNGAEYENSDPRVKIFHDEYEWPFKWYVGRLKNEACKRCAWERLVEVDHDDLLTPTALEEVSRVPLEYDMCYSNTVNINWPEITPVTWSSYYWWTNRPFKFMDKDVMEAVSAAPFPQSISRIWFNCNHLRARRRDFYTSIGGHNASLKISDDHDLILRTYLKWKIYHIDKPLYVYRIRGDNTRQTLAAEIQTTMWDMHNQYFLPMMMKRCFENKLLKIDLGGAIGCPDWYWFASVDRHNAHIICDLNRRRKRLKTDSVWYIRAHHIFEHLKDPIHVMNEAYRVLAHWGILEIEVPSDSPLFIDWKLFPATGNKSDPTHITSWNSRSFRYYTEAEMRKYIEPECNCKFTIIKPAREFLKFDNVPVVTITLMAEKWGERYYWANNWR